MAGRRDARKNAIGRKLLPRTRHQWWTGRVGTGRPERAASDQRLEELDHGHGTAGRAVRAAEKEVSSFADIAQKLHQVRLIYHELGALLVGELRGSGEVVALAPGDAEVGEGGELFGGLDPFCGDGGSDVASEGDE
ncbi:MAG: hypothetical protein QOH64_427 [Acidimicrobiaceae bacterium]